MKQSSASDTSILRQLLRDLSPFGVRALDPSEIDRCALFYELVRKWNPLLHLTTLISPEDFAHRHLAESFVAESRLRDDVVELWDVGSGVGVPGIPIAIRRPKLLVRLIESNKRKAVFLDEAAVLLGLEQVSVFADRFESLPPPPDCACLAARAVERMESIVDEIAARSSGAVQLLLFGGADLECVIGTVASNIWSVDIIRLPRSADRRLYDLQRST
ncbi:MAG: class I SAM-dependent methyltransferase [Blastocatellales bacterium]|nr:class I SAM-dependent methyltransferase [Blastocatellales bacterium]